MLQTDGQAHASCSKQVSGHSRNDRQDPTTWNQEKQLMEVAGAWGERVHMIGALYSCAQAFFAQQQPFSLMLLYRVQA